MKRFFVLLMTLAVILQAPVTASASAAVNVEPGVEYTGRLDDGNDNDRYNLAFAKQSSVQIRFKHIESRDPAAWKVSLYTDNRELLTEFTSDEDDPEILSDKVRVSAGSYYFEITRTFGGQVSNVDYFVKVIVVEESTGYFECEDNDKKGYANVVEPNRIYTGNLQDPSDFDYYRLNLTSPANVKLRFTHEDSREESSWGIYLLDAEELELTSFQSREDDLDLISDRVRVPAGSYYILVSRYYSDYNNLDYTIKAIVTDESKGNFEREPNDKRTYGQILDHNKVYTGNLQNMEDLDYYRVNISRPSRIKIQFKHAESREDADWKVILFNAEDVALTQFESDQNDTNKTSDRVRVPAGSYYIKVSMPYDHEYSNINYTLKAIVDGETKGFYEREDNDKMGYAQTIRLNKLYTGNLQDNMDKDYYKLKLTKSGTYKLQFKHNGSRRDGDWTISVLTAGANAKTTLTTNQGKKSVSKNVKLGKGTYYVYVRRSEFGAFNNMDYRIGILLKGKN